ncbi:carbohydrate sulfotransferase 11-like [Ptychodera flava]|uniref:carbohydrate sulfotransferase 11-like n=1 Tax=Ptychodera flava TaxID=63121 RepID=UPI00396A3BB2
MRKLFGKKVFNVLKLLVGFNMCLFIIHYNAVKLTQMRKGDSISRGSRDDYYPVPTTMATPINEVFEQRRRLVQDVCRNDNVPLVEKIDYGRILVDPAHSIMYCQVEKVGSSNWLRTFLILAGEFSANDTIPWSSIYKVYDHYKRLSQYLHPERLQLLQQYKKFMFVRHPFNRLLSAYVNKFEQQPSMELIAEMLKTLGVTPASNSSSVLTFPDFVRYLIMTKDSTETWNIHYKPIYYLCYPCNITYDIIGHLETVTRDSAYILNLMSADFEYPNFVPARTNSSRSDNLRKYFSTLTKEQIRELYNIYEKDFKLFGYEIPSYLNLTKA